MIINITTETIIIEHDDTGGIIEIEDVIKITPEEIIEHIRGT